MHRQHIRPAIESPIVGAVRPSIVEQGGGIPLGSAFWATYLDADFGIELSGSDVATWTSMVGEHVATPAAHAPSFMVNFNGAARNAVKFDIANTEGLFCHTLASLFSGDDAPVTVFLHVIYPTFSGVFCNWGVSDGTNNYYYTQRWFSGSGIGAYGKSGGGSTVSGTLRVPVVAATEYVIGLIRHGDTYDIALNGVRATGGSCALTSLGTLTLFSIGLLRAGSEYYHSDMELRRFAIASGSGITDAQIVALDDAWRGR